MDVKPGAHCKIFAVFQMMWMWGSNTPNMSRVWSMRKNIVLDEQKIWKNAWIKVKTRLPISCVHGISQQSNVQFNIEMERFCHGNYEYSQRTAFSSWCIANIAVSDGPMATWNWQKVRYRLCQRIKCNHFPIKLFKSGYNVHMLTFCFNLRLVFQIYWKFKQIRP